MATGKKRTRRERVEAEIKDLIPVLKNEKKNNSTRKAAAWALGKIGERLAVPDLNAILDDKEASESAKKYARLALVFGNKLT